MYAFNASLEATSPASSCPYIISNADGGKYPQQISKGDLLVEAL